MEWGVASSRPVTETIGTEQGPSGIDHGEVPVKKDCWEKTSKRSMRMNGRTLDISGNECDHYGGCNGSRDLNQ